MTIQQNILSKLSFLTNKLFKYLLFNRLFNLLFIIIKQVTQNCAIYTASRK